jgi:hypothetical protein
VKKSNNNERDKLTKEIFTRIQDRVKYGLDKFRTIFWQNPRPKNQGGWRLSDFGYMVLKELEYKDYPINIPKETVLTGQTILYMVLGFWKIKLSIFLKKKLLSKLFFLTVTLIILEKVEKNSAKLVKILLDLLAC